MKNSVTGALEIKKVYFLYFWRSWWITCFRGILFVYQKRNLKIMTNTNYSHIYEAYVELQKKNGAYDIFIWKASFKVCHTKALLKYFIIFVSKQLSCCRNQSQMVQWTVRFLRFLRIVSLLIKKTLSRLGKLDNRIRANETID